MCDSPPVCIKALFQNQEENGAESDGGSGDDDSGTDHVNCTITRTQLQRCEHHGVNSKLPDTFQTSNLLFYERFKAFQDYMLGKTRFTFHIIISVCLRAVDSQRLFFFCLKLCVCGGVGGWRLEAGIKN